jgi:hypothetical protein
MRWVLLILLLSAPPVLGMWCFGTGAGECQGVVSSARVVLAR